MRALVVYESMFGSTRTIAECLARGLRAWYGQVDTRAVGRADVDDLAGADLLVVGGPTHAHGMSRPQTRQAAADAPLQYGGGALLEPDSVGIGLRDWFDALPTLSGAAAAFDTRVDVPAVISGRASKGVAQRLRRRGFHLVDRPQSFLVAKGGSLLPGETDRAEAWGQALGRTLVPQSTTQPAGSTAQHGGATRRQRGLGPA